MLCAGGIDLDEFTAALKTEQWSKLDIHSKLATLEVHTPTMLLFSLFGSLASLE